MLKARSRRSILDAASALVAERYGPHFTVEELAERADVSRATVFNYFPSVSDVLITASVEKFDLISAAFARNANTLPPTDGSRPAVFEEVVRSVRDTDLLDVAASFGAVSGLGSQISSKQQTVMWEVLQRTSMNFSDHVAGRYPGWDRLEVNLMVGALMNGITIALAQWLGSSGGAITEQSRADWQHMLERVITGARSGYGSRD